MASCSPSYVALDRTRRLKKEKKKKRKKKNNCKTHILYMTEPICLNFNLMFGQRMMKEE